MLEIRGLGVRYGEVEAVTAFDLSLEQGEIVTLVGPTGCGKSSVLRAIAGLEPLAAGAIQLDGLRVTPEHCPPPEKRRTGLVFQDFALFPHLDVEKNVGFRVRDPAEVDHWIRVMGLEAHRHAMPETLSGGQKQRVALARSLAHRPVLVLLDEPLSNLDASMKSDLRWQIRESLEEAGVGAVWVTHDQEEALSVGDRVGIMNAGHLEQLGSPETCYGSPATRFVAGFLGEGAFLPGRLEPDGVETTLGRAPVRVEPGGGPAGSTEEVDVLVRPHDLGLESAQPGNGQVRWCRFEGATRLYAVQLDEGPLLRVRVNHELRIDDHRRVDVRIATGHPLAAFPSESTPIGAMEEQADACG